MSVRLPPPGVSAGDVWSYPTRTLTEKYVIIERASRGFSSDALEVYNSSGQFKNSRFIYFVEASASVFVKNRSSDPIPTATEIILDGGFNPANVKDHDDNTYATTSTSVPGGSTVDHVKYDLGSVVTGFLRAIIQSATAYLYTRVLVSSDDTTYTTVCEVVNSLAKCVYYGSFRYVKLQSYNSGSSGISGSNTRFYSVEVYPPDNNTEFVFNDEFGDILALVYNGYYQLLEVVYL